METLNVNKQLQIRSESERLKIKIEQQALQIKRDAPKVARFNKLFEGVIPPEEVFQITRSLKDMDVCERALALDELYSRVIESGKHKVLSIENFQENCFRAETGEIIIEEELFEVDFESICKGYFTKDVAFAYDSNGTEYIYRRILVTPEGVEFVLNIIK